MSTIRHKQRALLCFFFFSVSILLSAQGLGSWRTHLSFHDVTDIVETPNKVFALASGSLLSYSPDDQEIKKYSKYDGLNDSDIKYIVYSEEASALLIVYTNTNADIFTKDGIYNFSGIIDHNEVEDKEINGVDIQGKTAYVSTSFGVVEIDLFAKESPNSYLTLGNTFSACLKDNYIYVATDQNIRRGLISKNLSSSDNWEIYDPQIEHLQTWNINKILPFQDGLVFQQKNGAIFYKSDNKGELLGSENFKNARIVHQQLVGITDTSVHFWSSIDNQTVINNWSISGITGRKNNIYWVAQNSEGFGAIRKDINSNEHEIYLSNITINSPINNLCYFLNFQNNKLLVTGGRSSFEKIYSYPGTFMFLENGKWYHFDTKEIEEQVKARYPDIPGYICRDFVDAIEDPARPGRFYVVGYGEGLYEFEDFKLKTLYNFTNSPLNGVLDDYDEGDEEKNRYNRYHYIWTGGLSFDAENNLYVGHNRPESPVQILSAKKEWIDVPYRIGIYSPPIQQVLLTSKKQKWINFSRESGLLVIEDNGTPFDFSDDKMTTFMTNIMDQKGEPFAYGRVWSMAEDHKGAIWLGTEKGPVILYNPQNAIKAPNNFYCTRPILPYNDGTDNGYYLLDTEQINTIAVDGANRKWLGTERSGVYLVSENGMEVLHNFTEENSPLLSNTIFSIAIDSNTGEVYFATDKGLVSYMGDASTGRSDYSEVRAYPNPVRPEQQDQVTVTNLVKDSSVKITDARGNLVYQGTSKGGMFTWKCVDKNGQRVKTGVYLVIAATSDGSEGVVTKIMVIK